MEEPKFIKGIGKPLNQAEEPTRESSMESMATINQEIVTIATLKEAIINYLLLDDLYEYEDTTAGFCLILGRLEMSLIRRKQSLDEDRKALYEYTT